MEIVYVRADRNVYKHRTLLFINLVFLASPAGLSFFTRAIILNSSPTVIFERAFQGDDDYNDLPSDDHAGWKPESAPSFPPY